MIARVCMLLARSGLVARSSGAEVADRQLLGGSRAAAITNSAVDGGLQRAAASRASRIAPTMLSFVCTALLALAPSPFPRSCSTATGRGRARPREGRRREGEESGADEGQHRRCDARCTGCGGALEAAVHRGVGDRRRARATQQLTIRHLRA